MSNDKTRRSLPWWKKLLFSAIACVAVLLVLELGARCLVEPPNVPVYDEHRQVISVLGLPKLNEIMEHDPKRFWRLKAGLREVRVAGQINQQSIDFVVSTHNSLRSPPVAEQKARFRILVLGDSCAFGLGVNDDQTWPAQLQTLIQQSGFAAEVINAGVPGYTSFQGMKYLETEGLSLQPDLVVACFGFNDRDVWASQSDYETYRQFVFSRWESPLRRSRFYSILKGSQQSRASQGSGAAPRRPRLTPREFYETMHDIQVLCHDHGADLVLVVWPFEPQIRLKIPELDQYQALVLNFGREARTPVVNLVERFSESDEPLFMDHIHANPLGCHHAARSIFDVVKAKLPGQGR